MTSSTTNLADWLPYLSSLWFKLNLCAVNTRWVSRGYEKQKDAWMVLISAKHNYVGAGHHKRMCNCSAWMAATSTQFLDSQVRFNSMTTIKCSCTSSAPFKYNANTIWHWRQLSENIHWVWSSCRWQSVAWQSRSVTVLIKTQRKALPEWGFCR